MSLQRISLRDFVIVRQLELEVAHGFGVLSGETGAGKSILIDALQLVLGARGDANVVREGAPRAEISAEFQVNAPVVLWLQDNGFDAEFAAGPLDSQGDFTAIGDQDFFEHDPAVIRVRTRAGRIRPADHCRPGSL